MNVLENLVLRVRETEYAVNRLRISAPVTLIDEMIDEFEARGETPEFDDYCVSFGPYISVYVDDDLPDDTFMIKIESPRGCDLDGITQ